MMALASFCSKLKSPISKMQIEDRETMALASPYLGVNAPIPKRFTRYLLEQPKESRMKSENLPIFKSALELAVYIEKIVRGFEKYHKYTMGVDLREKSKEILYLINRANLSENKKLALAKLRDGCEDMKMLIQLSKELQAFKSFKQFEYSSMLTVSVCKQAQGWLGSCKT
jgi:hypothetical protein